MNTMQQVREAVAAFSKSEDLEGAIEELLSSGFARAEISLLAGTEAVEQKLGHSFTSTRDLEDDPTVPVTAYVAKESIVEGEGAVIGGLMYLGAFIGFAPVVASGGAIGAAILAAVLGGGGGAAIGSIFAGLLGKKHADYLNDQLEHGGLLLWVRTRDAEHEKRAVEILSRHSGQDVHVHGVSDHADDLQAHYKSDQLAKSTDLVTLNYHETEILVASDGHCFADGRVFATQADAKRFITEIEREV